MHKTCTGIKKNKKNKTLSIYSGLGVYRSQKFCFFWFFWCLCRFCEDHALVFLVFLMPVQVLWRSCFLLLVFLNACACFVKVCQDEKMKKHAFHQHFRPFRCIKHCKLQCFVLIFFQKPPPHGGPLSFGGPTSILNSPGKPLWIRCEFHDQLEQKKLSIRMMGRFSFTMVSMIFGHGWSLHTGMSMVLRINGFITPIYQGTIGCTPNSVPMVLIGLI